MSDNIIIGIDPGSNLGVCLIELDEDLKIKDIRTRTYILNNFIENEEFSIVERNLAVENIIKDLVKEYKPLAIGCEDCFKSKFANAVIQLAQYLITIRSTIYKMLGLYKINLYPPKYVKMRVSGVGTANKLDMLHGVENIEALKPFVRKDMTEHEVDSMSIAYVTYLDYLKEKELEP